MHAYMIAFLNAPVVPDEGFRKFVAICNNRLYRLGREFIGLLHSLFGKPASPDFILPGSHFLLDVGHLRHKFCLKCRMFGLDIFISY